MCVRVGMLADLCRIHTQCTASFFCLMALSPAAAWHSSSPSYSSRRPATGHKHKEEAVRLLARRERRDMAADMIALAGHE